MKAHRTLLSVLVLILLFLPGGAAFAAGAVKTELPGEDARIVINPNNRSDWVIVTPEELDANMELCRDESCSEQGVRQRFSAARVLFEIHSPSMPGRLRVEVYEDAFTHMVWDTQTIGLSALRKIPDQITETYWLSDRYGFYNMQPKTGDETDRHIEGSFLSAPEYEYETGTFSLYFYNGKAYLFLSGFSLNASANETRAAWLTGMKFIRTNQQLASAQPRTDLMPDQDPLILNLRPGNCVLTGLTEADAEITFLVNGEETQAAVDKDNRYSGTVTLTEGKNEITVSARKKGRQDEALTVIREASSRKATLVLKEFPYQRTDRDHLTVSGTADPEGALTVKLDDGEPVSVSVGENGAFEYTFTAEDFKEHSVEIRSSFEGAEDTAAQFWFTPVYEDAEEGLKAYRKLLDPDVTWRKLMDDPAAYVGKKVQLEVLIVSTGMNGGYITAECMYVDPSVNNRWSTSGEGKLIVIFDAYLEDRLSKGQSLTICGEVQEPFLSEPPLARVLVQYAVYIHR